MEVYAPNDALRKLETRLAEDEGKVAQSVGLRGAQIKYVVRRLIEQSDSNPEVVQLVERVLPPSASGELLSYARDAHGRFERDVFPALQRGKYRVASPPDWNALMGELEETLIEVRRLVVQNLSKHPGMKPYRLLSEWESLRGECEQQLDEVRAWELKRNEQRARLEETRIEQESLVHAPGFDTFSRLERSREILLHRKKETIEEWMRAWKEVEPILQSFSSKMKTFQAMENAQSRVLQLYLANPPSARTKDTHGAGLLMLLRLAVEALEEKKSPLKKAEREEARAILLRALENPLFVRYAEFARELEVALDANQREYYEHSLFARRNEAQRREQEAVRAGEQASEQYANALARANECRQKLVRLQKETEEVCRMNLGFTIDWGA